MQLRPKKHILHKIGQAFFFLFPVLFEQKTWIAFTFEQENEILKFGWIRCISKKLSIWSGIFLRVAWAKRWNCSETSRKAKNCTQCLELLEWCLFSTILCQSPMLPFHCFQVAHKNNKNKKTVFSMCSFVVWLIFLSFLVFLLRHLKSVSSIPTRTIESGKFDASTISATPKWKPQKETKTEPCPTPQNYTKQKQKQTNLAL